jgi:aldehyde dehydrogenase (NAD+)
MDQEEIGRLVSSQRDYFDSGATRDLSFRTRQLDSLRKAIYGNRSLILKALAGDMGKPAFEAYVAEISQVLSDIDNAYKRLHRWARPRRVGTPGFLFPASSFIYPEPFGVALIIAPWNYPMDLAVSPLVGAVAAGNCAVVKPSEIAPATAGVMAKILGETFDPAYVAVVEGGPEVAEALLAQRFDYIFYTGGTVVGKVVMEAASKHLTPVTLELGGKSPCIVEPDIDLEHAARRIAWGKYFNAGQTCIAPDYLLVNRAVKRDLLEAIAGRINQFYGDDPQKSPDFARIVSDRHFERISRLMESGEVVTGGQTDPATRYIAPTVIDGVSADDPVMREEIFGPLLPVIDYGELGEAIEFVNSRPRPLALYFFSRDRRKQERVLAGTTAGGCCINDVLVHFSNNRLPFGGVGDSGLGRYHGRWTFETFSNMKAVVRKSFLLDVYVRYPPYRNTLKWTQKILRHIT